MTAPPQAQAQSLAKAIRTDISLLSRYRCHFRQRPDYLGHSAAIRQSAQQIVKCKGVNQTYAVLGQFFRLLPILNMVNVSA